jgi:prepilin-type N-terminal cleavage/methylation domain-containing protein
MKNVSKQGFSLVELLLVITIMGILGTIGYQFGAKAMAKARAADLESQLQQIKVGLAKYYKDMGTFPYYLDYLIKKPGADDKKGWDAFTVATTGNAGDDDTALKDYWGGPYVDGMKMSPDVEHCLLNKLGGGICFGATYNAANSADTDQEIFDGTATQRINYAFADSGNPTIASGKSSNGYDNTSPAFYNVLQINSVPKDIAEYMYKDLNGGSAPTAKGNLIEASKGESDGGDSTMFIGIPALKQYSKFNRIVYRYFRLY